MELAGSLSVVVELFDAVELKSVVVVGELEVEVEMEVAEVEEVEETVLVVDVGVLDEEVVLLVDEEIPVVLGVG